MNEINWQERCELVECLAKRICRDLRHALDEVPQGNSMRPMMVERMQGFKRDLGDTSEYVHALHYELRRADAKIAGLEHALAEATRPEVVVPYTGTEAALREGAAVLLQVAEMEEHNEAIFKGKWKKGSKAWGGDFIARLRAEGMAKIREAMQATPSPLGSIK